MKRLLLKIAEVLSFFVALCAFIQIFATIQNDPVVSLWVWLALIALGMVGFTCARTLWENAK
jgi:hypothetical protein